MSFTMTHHDYTFAEYITLEGDSEIKHEFDAGEILAMLSGTARHSALAVNIGVALGTTRASICTVFQCGPIEYDPEDAAHTTITNPVLIVEVLPVTTEKGDRAGVRPRQPGAAHRDLPPHALRHVGVLRSE